MNNIKVNLSILLPGSTMLSVEESTRIAKNGERVIDTHKHDKTELTVGSKNEIIKVFTRKSRNAKQVIHLNEDAYDYMVSDNIPYKYKGVWKSLKPNERLRWHCNAIAESIGGIVDTIQVLDS